MTDKKIEDLLQFQKKVDADLEQSEFQKIFLSMNRKMLKDILKRDDVEPIVKELVQEAYDEFLEMWNKIFAEKDGEVALKDVEKELPANLWLKILLKSGKQDDKGDLQEDVDMEKIAEELEVARKNNQIN